MRLIGVSGKAGTGKDYISTTYLEPAGFRRWSLAFHFKIFLVGQGKATYEDVFITKPAHVRRLLQEEGTERGRNVFGEDIWCDTTLAWLRLMNDVWGQDQIVVPDVRFPNEVAAIHRAGGKVIRIDAPARDAASGLSAEARQHPSEIALDGCRAFDAHLLNDPNQAESVPVQLAEMFDRWGWSNSGAAIATLVGAGPPCG